MVAFSPTVGLFKILARLMDRGLQRLTEMEILVRAHNEEDHPLRGLLALPFRLNDATRPFSSSATAMIEAAVQNAFSKAKVPQEASRVYSTDFALTSITRGVPQLATASPNLYQDYDRLRSEAELRMAISPPLIGLAILAPIDGRYWLLTATVLGCIVLLAQAMSQARAANNILANAAYLGYLGIPSMLAVVDALKILPREPSANGEWMAAIIGGLNQTGSTDESVSALYGFLRTADGNTLVDGMLFLKDYDEIRSLHAARFMTHPANYEKYRKVVEALRALNESHNGSEGVG